MLRSIPFHSNLNNLRYRKALAFSHIMVEMSLTQSVNILATFNAYQYRIYKLDFCSYYFHIFGFLRSGKGRVRCIIKWYTHWSELCLDIKFLCPNIVQITVYFFVMIPSHTLPLVVKHCSKPPKPLGTPWKLIQILGDGDCLYLALSYALTGRQVYYAWLTVQITNHKAHWKFPSTLCK